MYIFSFLAINFLLRSQTIESTNVYPLNREEDLYFSIYDEVSQTIKGINFKVHAEGDSSNSITPAFEISLYLNPQGSLNKEDEIIIKKYKVEALKHLGVLDFNDQLICIKDFSEIKSINYRLGIWVNSNISFEEDQSDNDIDFKNPIIIKTKNSFSDIPENEESLSDDNEVSE